MQIFAMLQQKCKKEKERFTPCTLFRSSMTRAGAKTSSFGSTDDKKRHILRAIVGNI